MSERIDSVVADLEKITTDVRESFGGLDAAQLNWKADEKSWSVAQCLDHLITINSLYFPIFEKLRSANIANTFYEKYSPLSGFFGRYLIKAMMPENPKKMKTSKKAYPSASDLGGDIVLKFEDHQRKLAEHIDGISSALDLRTIMTSPLAGFVTYSVDDCLTMLVVHEQRHVLQAKRVMQTVK